MTIDSAKSYRGRSARVCLYVGDIKITSRGRVLPFVDCLYGYEADIRRLRKLLVQPVAAEIGVYDREIWHLAIRDSLIVTYDSRVAAHREMDADWLRNWKFTLPVFAIAAGIAVYRSERKRRDD